MKIKVNSCITVINPNTTIKNYCKTLIFNNPEYIKKKRMGFYVENLPQKVSLFYRNGNDLVFSFGCLDDIWKLHPYVEDYILEINNGKEVEFPEPKFTLYDYQEKAVGKMIKSKNGILKSPCGSGKSIMSMEMIRRFSKKALFICHTLDLIRQAKEYATTYLGLSGNQIGEISGGKVSIGSHITFATRQTLSRVDLLQFKNEWGTIIVDECGHCQKSIASIKEYSKIMDCLNARHKIGVSATPYTTDGINKAIYALLGDIKYEVPESEIKDKTIKAKVNVIHTNYFPSEEILDGAGIIKSHNDLINDIANNEERNKLIASKILEENEKGNKCIILSERINHLNKLNELIGYKGKVIDGNMTSKKSKELRQKILKDMKQGKENILFASYSLAREGLDIPILNRLFLATPKKEKTAIIQSVGRIERKYENKTDPIVYDFVDIKFDTAWKMFTIRKRIYKNNNNEVII